MKIYIAGPMRGKPHFNFPAFDIAETRLRAAGHEVFNPAAADQALGVKASEFAPCGETTPALRDALARDVEYISREADAIFMLEGWEQSLGAQAEWALARALGLTIIYQNSFDGNLAVIGIEPPSLPSAELSEAEQVQ